MAEDVQQCPCCKALWVKFHLVTELTKDSETATAKVFDKAGERHYWQGEDPDPDDAGFSVYNLECQSPDDGSFQFEGEPGTVGLACFDDSKPDEDRYRIVYISGSCSSTSTTGEQSTSTTGSQTTVDGTTTTGDVTTEQGTTTTREGVTGEGTTTTVGGTTNEGTSTTGDVTTGQGTTTTNDSTTGEGTTTTVVGTSNEGTTTTGTGTSTTEGSTDSGTTTTGDGTTHAGTTTTDSSTSTTWESTTTTHEPPCVVYVPTFSLDGCLLTIPKATLHIVDGRIVCEPAGEDTIDIGDCCCGGTSTTSEIESTTEEVSQTSTTEEILQTSTTEEVPQTPTTEELTLTTPEAVDIPLP